MMHDALHDACTMPSPDILLVGRRWAPCFHTLQSRYMPAQRSIKTTECPGSCVPVSLQYEDL